MPLIAPRKPSLMAALNSQLECHSDQEARKGQDYCPDPNNMESFRTLHLLLPILGWRAELPCERGTVDRDCADDPDHDPDEEGNHGCAPEHKAGCSSVEERQGNP